jgi:hypothetical protein
LKAFIFTALCIFLAGVSWGQEGSFSFGGGTISSPGPSSADVNSGNFFAPSLSGGTYLSSGGYFTFKKNLGAGGEVSWRASENLYQGYQPYRPIFYSFYGVYAPKFNDHIGAELLGGVGGESVRFYSNFYQCNYFSGCTNYVSSNHFMGVFGGGIKFYPTGGNWFIRPEARLYLINNNVEFSSGTVVRYGVSLGYSFGGERY